MHSSMRKPPPAVILIEPGEETRERVGERLRMQGYQVTTAARPAEGAHMAISNPPAAVVANLWMPSISGVQLCRLLRAEPATACVPVILRGQEDQRHRFWAERAGAAAYVGEGRMGDLVRALSTAIASNPPGADFFTQLLDSNDIRDRIAAYLDSALFDSVIAAEVRALSLCGAFDRLFDMLTQLACQIMSYRWIALSTITPPRWGLHCHPNHRASIEHEARRALGMDTESPAFHLEDEDAADDGEGPSPLVVPVRFADALIGNLAFAARKNGDPHDEEVIGIIARELSGPIRMATLVEEAQRLATVDPLTGLMNRRAFLAALDVEMERSQRLRYPLSLLLLDVDHFKVINDTRGHASGDAVLASLGELLGQHARKVDVVARWGGEEFVLVLAGADEESGKVAAERFRQAIESTEVLDSRGERIPVTASIGLARLEPGEPRDSFIDRADRAMYGAKTAGRNRVSVAPARALKVTATQMAAVVG
jgi:two-component system, cell cycle response regulator